MSRKLLLLFAILPLLKACLALPASADEPAAPRYAITDLGTLPGGKYSAALAINEAGQVVGWSGTHYSMPYARMDNQAVLWERGTVRPLPVPDGDLYSAGIAINNEGEVLIGQCMNVGMSEIFMVPGDHTFALLWKPNVTTLLPLSQGVAMNNKGQVVGTQEVTKASVIATPWYLWGPSGRVPLRLLPYGSVNGFNDAGQIVGTWSSVVSHAFLYNNGTVTDLPMPPGFKQTDACGINDKGQVIFEAVPFVGAATLPTHSFLWGKDGLTDLGSDTLARGINGQGQIVGIGGGRGGGFLWQRGHRYDLLAVIPTDAGWMGLSPNSINNHGQIVGQGEQHGERHAFLMTPMSAPPPAPPIAAPLAAGTTEPSASVHALGSSSVLAPAEVDASFILDKPTLVLGEPVWLTFRFTNRSTVPLRFLEATDRGSVLDNEYEFTAFDAEGHEASPSPSSLVIINGYIERVTLAPGASFQKHLFLPDWFTLHQPGTYALTCKRTLSVARLPAKGQPVRSPVRAPDDSEDIPVVVKLPLQILPPNEAALGQVIQGLRVHALAGEGTGRDEAALSLSVIPDARIIPILAELLTRRDPHGRFSADDSKFLAVAGLSQFSSPTATAALLTALRSGNEGLRRAAGDALRKTGHVGQVLGPLQRELAAPSSADRVTAVLALGATQDARAFGPLASVLQDRNPNVRYEAAKSLGTLGDRRAVPLLEARLADENMTLRLACVKGLASLNVPIQTEWLTPIVRTYALPSHEYSGLEAMTVMCLDCGDRAARALASCLQFDDPRPSNGYNFFLIYNLEACPDGPKYYYKWMNGDDNQTAVENNRKILASIKAWLQGLNGPRVNPRLNASGHAPISKRQSAVPPQNTALQSELLAMMKQDQDVRQRSLDKPKDPAIYSEMTAIDTKDTARMKQVVALYGWPSERLVGVDGAGAAWLLVQHADADPAFQAKWLPLMQAAADRGTASKQDVALLTDRVLLAQGKEQVYGTQFTWKTGKVEPRPLKDPTHVDKRRKAMGLMPLAEYRKMLIKAYKLQTLPKRAEDAGQDRGVGLQSVIGPDTH